MRKKIVVVGSINLDLVARVDRMPAEGETLTGRGFATNPGGKGANQAVGAARLGAEVMMIGRLGTDSFAAQLRQGLNDAGVDTSLVREVEGSSGIAMITVTAGGGNSIVVIPGANGTLRSEELAGYAEEMRGAAMILAQLEVPLKTVVQLARIAGELSVPFMLDPAPAQALPAELLRRVTWLTPNESETACLLRSLDAGASDDERVRPTPERAAERLLAAGVRNVVLKLGARGVYVAGRDLTAGYVQGFAVHTVDSTAAGDAFNAGFAYALTEGMRPQVAAEFACAVAAISVTRAGAQASMPRLAEVTALLTGETSRAGLV